jgi:hypothetical protein
MRRRVEQAYNVLTRQLPPTVAAALDSLVPSFRGSWGGPLNGQARRREIVREVAVRLACDSVYETGTFRGTSTEFLAAVFGTTVDTVEGNARYYAYSKRRLAVEPQVTVHFGDSREFLRSLGRRVSHQSRPFIYLDAHWAADLPLAEELVIISRRWGNAVVMIDDFAVPDDEGYGFDDYGPGQALIEDYLPTELLVGWTLYYPAAHSSTETGAKRGSALLLGPEVQGTADLSTVRRWRTF